MKLGLTDEQKAARRSVIGGSDAGAIVAGGEEWQKLWAIKTGRSNGDDLSNILAVQMGSFTEPLNAYWYEKQTGRMVTHRGDFMVHPTIPYLAANLDGVTVTADGQPAYVDFKHVGRSGDQLTLRYTAQCTHCAAILGLDWWVLSVFVGNSKWELTEQEIDPFFAADYLAKCAEFWKFVEADQEPPPVEPLPVPPPRKLRIVRLDDEFRDEWPNWAGDCIRAFRKYVETKPAHDAHEASKREVKDLMPEDVGEIRRGLLKAVRDKAGAIRFSGLKRSAVDGHN